MTETRAPVSFFHPSFPNSQTLDIDLTPIGIRVYLFLSLLFFARTFSFLRRHARFSTVLRKGGRNFLEAFPVVEQFPRFGSIFKKYKSDIHEGSIDANGDDDRAVEQYRILIFPGKLGVPARRKRIQRSVSGYKASGRKFCYWVIACHPDNCVPCK